MLDRPLSSSTANAPRTPRRILERREVLQSYATWREGSQQATGVVPSCTDWLSGLRNYDTDSLTPVSHQPAAPSRPPPSSFSRIRRTEAATSSPPSAVAVVPCILTLPFELLTLMMEWLDTRSLAYDIPRCCRALRKISRQPKFWKAFRLKDLVRSDLPAVSRYAQLTHLYPSEAAHKEHFWLRQLGSGLWPASTCGPTELDLSCCSTPLSLRHMAQVAQNAMKWVKRINFSMCTQVTNELLELLHQQTAEGFELEELNVSYCTQFSGDALCSLLKSSACVTSLQILDISFCEQLLDEPATFWGAVLRGAFFPTKLTKLTARSVFKLPACDAAPLVFPPSLVSVNLSHSVTAESWVIRSLAQQCRGLQELIVSGCTRVDDSAFRRPTGSTELMWPSLRYIAVDHCPLVTDHTVVAILDETPLHARTLRRICVEHNPRVTGQFIWRLAGGSGAVSVEVSGCNAIVKECFRDTKLRQCISDHCGSFLSARSVAFLNSNRVLFVAAADRSKLSQTLCSNGNS